MAVVNELITELGINLKEGTTKKIDEFEKKINNVADSFEKIGHLVTGGLGIKDFFGGAIGRAQDIINTSKAIGMSTDALQKWQYAAKTAGVSADSVVSDLENLNANYFMTEKGVYSLADSMKKMSAQEANWWGNRLGLSRDTILLLREGSAALKERQKAAQEAGAITPFEELEKADKLKRELDAQKERFLKLADVAAYRLIPAVNKLLEIVNGWLDNDPGKAEMIIQGMTAALVALTAPSITTGILNLFKTLTPLVGMLGPWGLLAAAIVVVTAALVKLYEKCNTDWKDSALAKFVIRFVDGLKDAYKWVEKLIGKLKDLGFKKRPDMNVKSPLSDLTDQEKDDLIKGKTSLEEIQAKRFWESYNPSGNLQNGESISLDKLSQSMSSEVTIKPASTRAIAEALHEMNMNAQTASSSVVKNADFNGANIQIIATGAELPDVLYSLQEMGADVSDSYNGLPPIS